MIKEKEGKFIMKITSVKVKKLEEEKDNQRKQNVEFTRIMKSHSKL